MKMKMKVFDISWYKYLFAKPFLFKALLCRFRGHPYPVMYSPNKPRLYCLNCRDFLD